MADPQGAVHRQRSRRPHRPTRDKQSRGAIMRAMTDPNLNALWARCIAEELLRAGVRQAVLCPGSRNAPLLFAMAGVGLAVISHVDERSAGFLALGQARASGRPVAICVTSGSAVANLLPAVAEAHAAGIPLVVITADRPWELHGCGAPQTMAQVGLLSPYAETVALGEPTATDATLRALRAQVSRLAQRPGPVHLNVPLRDPLPPLPDPSFVPGPLSSEALHGRGEQPYTRVADHPVSDETFTDAAWSWLKPGLRGVIVAGATGVDCTATARLAAATGFPVLADAASGLRQANCPGLVALGDALVGGPMGRQTPELIIQVGVVPLSRGVYEWLDRAKCPWLALEPGANQDFLARAWAAIERPSSSAWKALGERLHSGDKVWHDQWLTAERHARGLLAASMSAEPWGEVLAAHLACTHPGFRFLHLASSMAIRHGNLHCLPADRQRPIHANRGLNGIDGTLGTFLGECRHHRQPGLLLCGDLAMLHDLPALAAAEDVGARGAIVVLNNGGGGIFDFLPVSQVPGYEQWVRASHGLDFRAVADQFSLVYGRVAARASLQAALDAAAEAPGLTLIECTLTAGDTVARHRALLGALVA